MKINATGKVKVGDIFVNSWGYDQTNIDYYQVIDKTKKGIKIRPISSEVKEDGFMQGKSTPKVNDFVGNDIMVKFPYEYSGDSCLYDNVYINFEYGCGQLWSGKPERASWYA
jgi:hypothetical protein